MNVRSVAITATWKHLVVTPKVHLPVAVTLDTPEMANSVQVCSMFIDITVQDVGRISLENYKLSCFQAKFT